MGGSWVDVLVQPFSYGADLNGARVCLTVSPYDVPLAARGVYDPSRRLFTIDLQYMTRGEPTDEQDRSGLVITTGRRSGRIYKIVVDVGSMKADRVALEVGVRDQVSRVLEEYKAPNRASWPNARAIGEALSSSREIYGDLELAR